MDDIDDHIWVEVPSDKPTLHKTWVCERCGREISTRASLIKASQIRTIRIEYLMKIFNVRDCDTEKARGILIS